MDHNQKEKKYGCFGHTKSLPKREGLEIAMKQKSSTIDKERE